MLAEDGRAKIPESYRPVPGMLVTRLHVVKLDLPAVRRIANLAAVLFEQADPEARE